MGIDSGRNSGSILKVSLKRRLFGRNKEVEDESEAAGGGRDYKRPSSERSARSFEGNGYVKYSLGAGTDVYISSSNDDPFIDFDEPKADKAGGRFLGGLHTAQSLPSKQAPKPVFGKIEGPSLVFSNALPEIKFNKSDFEEAVVVKEESDIVSYSAPVAQTAMTSSSESVPNINSPDIISFEEEFHIEVEHASPSAPCEICEDDAEAGVERLPPAPAHAERLPAARYVPKGGHAVAPEAAEATGKTTVESVEVPVSIAPPISVMALPSSLMLTAVPAPAAMLMLPEPAQVSEQEMEAALEGTEDSALAVMAQLPSGLYTEGIEPIADAVAEEKEAISSNAECTGQLADTSSATVMRTVPLLEYSDYAGYDFLPPITEPVRREPRVAVLEASTISQMPEFVEIEDEVGGVMKLTVAGMAGDEAEYSDATPLKEIEIPDDGMEELCIVIDRERDYLAHLMDITSDIEIQVTAEPENGPIGDVRVIDVGPMIEEVSRAANALAEVSATAPREESLPEARHTLTSEDEEEVSEMVRMLIEMISAPEAEGIKAVDAGEVPRVRGSGPLVSFVFGNGVSESVHSFY
jgi:hypothetical protein